MKIRMMCGIADCSRAQHTFHGDVRQGQHQHRPSLQRPGRSDPRQDGRQRVSGGSGSSHGWPWSSAGFQPLLLDGVKPSDETTQRHRQNIANNSTCLAAGLDRQCYWPPYVNVMLGVRRSLSVASRNTTAILVIWLLLIEGEFPWKQENVLYFNSW